MQTPSTFSRQKTKRPPDIKPPAEEEDTEELEGLLSIGSLGEDQETINSQLEDIRGMSGALHELASSQYQSIEELSSNQTETARILKSIESPAQETIKTEKVDVLPELLDFDNPKERLLFEKALLTVAYDASDAGKKSESFRKWVALHSPIEKPLEFVNTTHEKLKQQLETNRWRGQS